MKTQGTGVPTISFQKLSGAGSLAGGSLTTISDTRFLFGFTASAANNGGYTVRVAGSDLAGNAVHQSSSGNVLTLDISNRPPVASATPAELKITLGGLARFDG